MEFDHDQMSNRLDILLIHYHLYRFGFVAFHKNINHIKAMINLGREMIISKSDQTGLKIKSRSQNPHSAPKGIVINGHLV